MPTPNIFVHPRPAFDVSVHLSAVLRRLLVEEMDGVRPCCLHKGGVVCGAFHKSPRLQFSDFGFCGSHGRNGQPLPQAVRLYEGPCCYGREAGSLLTLSPPCHLSICHSWR